MALEGHSWGLRLPGECEEICRVSQRVSVLFWALNREPAYSGDLLPTCPLFRFGGPRATGEGGAEGNSWVRTRQLLIMHRAPRVRYGSLSSRREESKFGERRKLDEAPRQIAGTVRI